MIIISEILYQGKRQYIRIETNERVRSNYYVYIGEDPWHHLVSNFYGKWNSERLDQETLRMIECILVAAHQ